MLGTVSSYVSHSCIRVSGSDGDICADELDEHNNSKMPNKSRAAGLRRDEVTQSQLRWPVTVTQAGTESLHETPPVRRTEQVCEFTS